MKLEGRAAIVTGAGRNIGEAVASVFADEGARVAVVDMDQGRAAMVANQINASHPGAALPLVCDVSVKDAVQGMISRVVSRFGRVDVLVNNVAITDRKTILDLDEDEWDRVLRVTLTSVFLCTKYAGRQMAQQGRGGSIINMASTSGHRGRGNATAYTAAKGGVLNLTRSLAIQLAPYKIRVNSLTPNRVGSPVGEDTVREGGTVRNLVGRNGLPLDVARAALFLASDDAEFITAADLLVDGGALAAAAL
jgi:NAD(P)-dependent dehydrogenase (short-subunit alcohol dehydrogenase family)